MIPVPETGSLAAGRTHSLERPFGAMGRCVHLLASTGNGPASKEGFQPNHQAREIFADGHITADRRDKRREALGNLTSASSTAST